MVFQDVVYRCHTGEVKYYIIAQQARQFGLLDRFQTDKRETKNYLSAEIDSDVDMIINNLKNLERG